MFVSDILKAKGPAVESVPPEATVGEAATRLAERRIGALLVIATGNRVVGVLSERDIVRGAATQGPAALDLQVTELMTAEVVNCSPNDTVKEIMEVMTRRRIRHLPVVEDGKLLGVISIGDVVKHRLDETRQEAEALKDYVRGI